MAAVAATAPAKRTQEATTTIPRPTAASSPAKNSARHVPTAKRWRARRASLVSARRRYDNVWRRADSLFPPPRLRSQDISSPPPWVLPPRAAYGRGLRRLGEEELGQPRRVGRGRARPARHG